VYIALNLLAHEDRGIRWQIGSVDWRNERGRSLRKEEARGLEELELLDHEKLFIVAVGSEVNGHCKSLLLKLRVVDSERHAAA
jgi:hypothetical protein